MRVLFQKCCCVNKHFESSFSRHNEYTVTHTEYLVGTFLCILIRTEWAGCVSELKAGIVTAGMLGVMGNKGVRSKRERESKAFILVYQK